jgi:arginase family enzyme
VGLVLLDAHPDLFDVYHGFPLSALPDPPLSGDEGVDPAHLLILGAVRNAVELDFIREKRIRYVPAREVERAGVPAMLALARQTMAASTPSTSPWTSTWPIFARPGPAPRSRAASELASLDLCRGLPNLPVRAMDIVEVSPPLDQSDITVFLALQLVFETLAVLARKAG